MSFILRGKDFQAHESFEFEASGLTVLIGDSNEGKSAIFRALRGLIRNELGAHFIRNGTKKLEVSLTIDGQTYTATRTKSGSTKYIVNPGPSEKKYESVGRDVPQPIKDLLLNEVEIGKESMDPVFARQGSTQFLLEESGPMLNTIMGAFSSTEKLEGGKTEAKARMGKLNTEAGTLAGQLRQAEEVKAKLDALANGAEVIDTTLRDLSTGISHGQALITVLDDLIVRRRRLEHLIRLLSRLVVPVTTEAEVGLMRLTPLTQLVDTRTRHAHLTGLTKRLVAPVTAEAELSLKRLASFTQLVDARTRHIMFSTLLDRSVTPDVGPLLVQAEIVRLLGIIFPAQLKLRKSQDAYQKAELLVATWTRLVAQHRLSKSLTETIDQIKVRDNSTAKVFADRLEVLHVTIEADQEQAVRRYKQGHALAKLIEAIEARNLKSAQAEEADLDQSGLQSNVARIQEQLEAARAEEYRLAHAITCPSCGDNFIQGSTGEHIHGDISNVGK